MSQLIGIRAEQWVGMALSIALTSGHVIVDQSASSQCGDDVVYVFCSSLNSFIKNTTAEAQQPRAKKNLKFQLSQIFSSLCDF